MRSWLSRVVMMGLVLVAGLMAPGQAVANPKYAAFVIHEGTGDVLFSRYADSRRYPASLTKMMTLYVLFEDIESGRIKLDDKIKISTRAAGQPASKLGIKKGTTIKVETAIEALVIKSANDVATAVAEHVSGSEVAFARRMTRTARDLGMRSTTFRNASGLPNRRQVTTARDMAKLAIRLRQDFPSRQHYFKQSSFKWNGKKYRSHNNVLRSFSGATGLKTGYTRASGYNLATSATRNGHPLVGIVLGGRSGATRDRHMRQIMANAYSAIKARPSRIKSAFTEPPRPSLKPGKAAPSNLPVVMASIVDMPVTNSADVLNLKALEDAIASLAPAPVGQGDADIEQEPRDWSVQLGAYRQQIHAMQRLSTLEEDVTTIAPEAERTILPKKLGGRTLYRARYADVTEAEAAAVCDALKPKGEDCLAMPAGR
ncbi:MAG: D-alanyl-D-alanine carboxypeptidase [Parvularculaceae bacterium]|nr:D-alanyl-D-alanine carboxypeptidase [Parvularculaceae bacterium]